MDEIWTYIAADDPNAADRLVSALREKARLLIDHPQMGIAREFLAPGLRALFHARYALYYLITPSTIDIVRILHGARDAQARFDEDAEA